MDELGFNKIAAAILATGLGFMGLKEVSHMAMHVSAPETPAYRIAVLTPTTNEAPVDLPFPQPNWVNAMDAERGAKVFKKCTSCHNAEDGGANGTGPNLWNVVGKPAGQVGGFNYSSAMANSGLIWDYETLDGFFEKPTRYLSGTAMNFVGLKKEEDRAAVIEYLRLKSAAPIAQPEPIIVVENEAEEMVAEAEGMGEAVENNLTESAETAGETTDAVVESIGTFVDETQDVADDVVKSLEGVAEDVSETITTTEDTPATPEGEE